MEGTMLWFNLVKGFGFIRTEEEERLYVAQSGFVPEHVPTARCAGRRVLFDRQADESTPCAVNVSFPPPVDRQRARPRHSRGSGMSS